MKIEPLPSCCPDLRTPAASHDEKLHYQLLSVLQFRKDIPNCFDFLITQSAIFDGCCETYVRAPKALNWVHINYPSIGTKTERTLHQPKHLTSDNSSPHAIKKVKPVRFSGLINNHVPQHRRYMVIEVPSVNLDFHKTFGDAVILFPVIESLFNGERLDFFLFLQNCLPSRIESFCQPGPELLSTFASLR